MKPVQVMKGDASHDPRQQNELGNARGNLFCWSNKEYFCDMKKKMIKPGGHGNMFSSALQYFW